MLLKEVLKNLFSKPFTVRYPKEKAVWISPNFRGKVVPIPEKCKGHAICVRNCPSYAIKMINNNRNIEIDQGKCVLCGLCVYNCPEKAIKIVPEFEHATKNPEKLKLR